MPPTCTSPFQPRARCDDERAGIALGGPVLTALTIRLDRRTILIGALAVFVVASLVLVLTAHYRLFVVARVAAFAAVMSVVPPERTGRAISVVICGVAVSPALGVPVGTLVGETLGCVVRSPQSCEAYLGEL